MHQRVRSTDRVWPFIFLLLLPLASCEGGDEVPASTEGPADNVSDRLPAKTGEQPADEGVTQAPKIPPGVRQIQEWVMEDGKKSTGTEVDLGTIDFPNGQSPEYSVDIPPGAIAFVVVIAGAKGVTYTVTELKNPKGTVLAAGMQFGSHLNRVMPGIIGGSAAFMVPNTPDIAEHFVPGKYSFSLSAMVAKGFSSAPDTNPAQGYAFIKMGPAPAGGTVDVNVLCTGAAGIAAATAPTNARVKNMLGGWDKFFSQVKIKLGTIRYFDVDPAFSKIESIQGIDSELAEACRSTGDKPRAISVLLTDGIFMGGILGGLGTILGVSGGIPGTVMVNGLESSCLAISLTAPKGTTVDLAPITVAHEAGHFLGLFHSSENMLGGLAGMKHDPISDTPEEDKNNLMFNNPMEATYLSPMQGVVMRSNPLVY